MMLYEKNVNPVQRLFLLSIIGICLLSVQVCSGFEQVYEYTLDLTVDPSTVTVGSPATITIHAGDPYHTNVNFANAAGKLSITSPSAGTSTKSFTADATGTYTTSFSPPSSGTYTFQATSSYNYVTLGAPFPSDAGTHSATSASRTLTAKSGASTVIKQQVSLHAITPPNQTTQTPVTQPPTTVVTGSSPAVTVQNPSNPPVSVTDNGVVPQSTRPVSNPPASVSDSIAPQTVLNITGTSDGSGGFVSEVNCTLTAADNAGGSGVNLIQYSFDGSGWFTYTKPFSVVRPGMTTVYYRSTDNAGNTEVANVKAIQISGSGVSSAESPSQTAARATPWLSGEMTLLTVFTVAAVFIFIRQYGRE
jgi:hypothetical protein